MPKRDPDSLRTELIEIVRNGIGPIATPHEIYFVTKLPKTRSGKIMRRVLKAIAGNEKVGDISTLEDSAAVKDVQDAFTELQSVQLEKIKIKRIRNHFSLSHSTYWCPQKILPHRSEFCPSNFQKSTWLYFLM